MIIFKLSASIHKLKSTSQRLIHLTSVSPFRTLMLRNRKSRRRNGRLLQFRRSHLQQRQLSSNQQPKTIQKQINSSYNHHPKKSKVISQSLSLVLLTGLGYAHYTRKWRDDHLMDVPSVSAKDFFIGNTNGEIQPSDDNGSKRTKGSINGLRRDLLELETIIARNGLMGKFHSVKDELDRIRSWHRDNGFRGGIVLRELNVPLYYPEEVVLEGGDDVEPVQPNQMKQRECYYLYYEIKPNGHTLQQIFCRGTTISDDIYTCLQSRLVFDEELGIRVHSGFRDHANRLVRDVLPLLGPPYSLRSTVEVSGHSLGGAVAFLVSMKLKKMGYNVTKVTAVAGARFCDPKDVQIANSLLPKDALRVEDDLDGVPFLPPWASGVGDKLWFVNENSETGRKECNEPKYIERDVLASHDHPLHWVESAWNNMRTPEILAVISKTHRITSHRVKIQSLINNMKSNDKDPSDAANT